MVIIITESQYYARLICKAKDIDRDGFVYVNDPYGLHGYDRDTPVIVFNPFYKASVHRAHMKAKERFDNIQVLRDVDRIEEDREV